MLENEHEESARGVEVELIHFVKIVEIFEACLHLSASVCQTLCSYFLESFLKVKE